MLWYSEDSTSNSAFLFQQYPEILHGFESLDQVGHSVLEGAMDRYKGLPWETTLGFALLRRAVTQFAGVRYMLERSAIQSASLVARSLFETLLAARYLAYGARRFVSGRTPTTPRGREIRSRYYRTEELRREIYRRQAAIDDRFGVRPLSGLKKREIQEEIRTRLAFLQRHFLAQNRRFGPLLCFPSGKQRPKHFDVSSWFTFGFRGNRAGKVTNVRHLAAAFGWLRDYEILYEAFSGFAHVRGLSHDVEIESGGVAARVPHAPDDFETIAYFCLHWQLFILMCLGRAYNPGAVYQVQATDIRMRAARDQLEPQLPLGLG